jgi:hypothetical protein
MSDSWCCERTCRTAASIRFCCEISLQYSSGEVVTLPQCQGNSLNAAEIGPFSSTVSAIQQFLTFTPPASRSTGLPVPCGLPGAVACPPDLEFYRPSDSATNSFFPNNDNKYIAALVRPKPRQVLLMRAMGATHTPGTTAQPWQPSMVDLRYWSMCSNVYRPPYPVVSIHEPRGRDHSRVCRRSWHDSR